MIRRWEGPYLVTRYTAAEVASKARFRHYKPEEREIGRRFVRKALIEGMYYFDVYLMTRRAEEVIKRVGLERATMAVPFLYRIDCVIETPAYIYIVEIKQRLRPSGLGELLIYSEMYKEQYEPTKPIKLAYVYEIHDDDTAEVAEKYGIILFKI